MDSVVEQVHILHNPGGHPSAQQNANLYLQSFQDSSAAWEVAIQILNLPLHGNISMTVLFFAASVLYNKISKQWVQCGEANQASLRHHLLLLLKQPRWRNAQMNVVTRKLCLCVSGCALRCSVASPSFLSDALSCFRMGDGNLDAGATGTIIELLTVLPEELEQLLNSTFSLQMPVPERVDFGEANQGISQQAHLNAAGLVHQLAPVAQQLSQSVLMRQDGSAADKAAALRCMQVSSPICLSTEHTCSGSHSFGGSWNFPHIHQLVVGCSYCQLLTTAYCHPCFCFPPRRSPTHPLPPPLEHTYSSPRLLITNYSLFNAGQPSVHPTRAGWLPWWTCSLRLRTAHYCQCNPNPVVAAASQHQTSGSHWAASHNPAVPAAVAVLVAPTAAPPAACSKCVDCSNVTPGGREMIRY